MHIYKFHMFLIFPIKGGRLTAGPEDGERFRTGCLGEVHGELAKGEG